MARRCQGPHAAPRCRRGLRAPASLRPEPPLRPRRGSPLCARAVGAWVGVRRNPCG
jgi:hypothetical protein